MNSDHPQLSVHAWVEMLWTLGLTGEQLSAVHDALNHWKASGDVYPSYVGVVDSLLVVIESKMYDTFRVERTPNPRGRLASEQ